MIAIVVLLELSTIIAYVLPRFQICQRRRCFLCLGEINTVSQNS